MPANRPTHAAPRSWLYVPGDKERMLDGAAERGADAIICDLEDAVAPDRKPVARSLVGAFVADRSVGGRIGQAGPQLWVRLGATSLDEDLTAIDPARLTGLILPGATLDGLAALSDALTRHHPGEAPPIVALVESAVGVQQLPRIAALSQVTRLALGEADLRGELGLSPGGYGLSGMDPIRLACVVASTAAGIAAPYGPTATEYRDTESLRRSTEHLLTQGFRGRTAIHPAQIPVINDVFTPSVEEVEQAERDVRTFEAEGGGAVADGGRMVDAAVVRSALDVLARARHDRT